MISKSVLNGRFCIFALLLQCLLLCHGSLNATSCQPQEYHDVQKVIKVIDGDTVILGDDRHVRLIGINTPEIDHEKNNAEAGAREARDFLTQLLSIHPEFYLYYDVERHDRYKRSLAHLFLPDGSNVQQLMLEKGLATPFIIPPNLAFVDCYQKAGNAAMEDRIGLWAYPDNAVVETDNINPRQLNRYVIVAGKVTEIIQNDSLTGVKLSHNVDLIIHKKQLPYFRNIDLEGMKDKRVRARGWLKKRKNNYLIQIYHPFDLKIISEN